MNALHQSIAAAALLVSTSAGAADSIWAWERYEASFGTTVTMKGTAKLKLQSAHRMVFELQEEDAAIESFEVRVRVGPGGRLMASFSPPNSEKVVLVLEGTDHRDAPSRQRYLVLTSSTNGNFLVIRSRSP